MANNNNEFDDVRGKTPGGSSGRPYMPIGYSGRVSIEGFKISDGFKGKAYIVEFEVLDADKELGVRAGFLSSQVVKRDNSSNKMHTGHILGWAHAVALASGLPAPTDEEGPAAVAALFAGDGRSAAGVVCWVRTFELKLKNGSPFTKFVWGPVPSDNPLDL